MIPAEVFSGEEFEMDPPMEEFEISHTLSGEEVEFGFETPRLKLHRERKEQVFGDEQELLWFHMVSALKNAWALLSGRDFSAHQQNVYDGKKQKIVERRFFMQNLSSDKMEKV